MSTSETAIQQRFEGMEDKPVAGIMDRAICLQVEFKKPGKRRKVVLKQRTQGDQLQQPLTDGGPHPIPPLDPVTVDAEVNVKRVHVSKDIFVAKEYDAVSRKDREVANFLRNIAVPSMFKSGIYLVPIPMVDRVDTQIIKFSRERQALVEALCARYASIIEEAKAELGPLFKQSDYIPTEEFPQHFSFIVAYVSYGVAESLKGINENIWRREREKAEQQIAEASAEIQVALRTSMAELVNYAVDRLTNNPDGKQRQFKGDKLRDFLETFHARNITNDTELAALVDKAKALLDGADPATLKDNQDVRQRLHDGFAEVQAELETMVELKPGRKFRFAVGQQDESSPVLDTAVQAANESPAGE